jgi:2-haloacid dehalogenase
MSERPSVVVFDVNETLSDLSALDARFEHAGAPAALRQTWFASVLRDGFGLAAAGTAQPFADVAAGVLRPLLHEAGVADVDSAVEHVMQGFSQLDVHEDVPDGVRALRAAGLRLVTLSNGSRNVAQGLLTRAGLEGEFEQLLSVEDAGRWKPARAPYEHAATVCDVPVEKLLLVAVHPWDIDGAARAGLQTAWLNRSGTPYPSHLTPPGLRVVDLRDLAAALA